MANPESSERPASSQDPTVGLCLGPHGGPRGRRFHMSEVPLYNRKGSSEGPNEKGSAEGPACRKRPAEVLVRS
eukprot:CAMPEP_0180206668 /NCGR_PEP_ID=MMETSP0987-20121128/9678_1 /TAXON_ID=697907 /ORGANISM="non described non described, Strain CCMP2293" /LENGTH=72 /DNA_ID=CAMNT_0022162461 /DNA_START=73 /DNA_END=291 /DNA_ORIENTATION=+